jgi:hypothetical protein
MDRQILKRRLISETSLLEIVRDVWQKFPPEKLMRLVERLPCLIEAVIEAEGGYFDEKYAPCKHKNQLVYNG